MKKSLALTLALVFVLGIAGTAFAANPFVDVPANHWAYSAVKTLAHDGLVDGMSDGTFQGDREMTRYEMAQIVAKAMARTDKANAADKALIEKIQAEFASELDNLGVRVSNLEKKVGNVTFFGDARIRYQDFNKADNQPSWAERFRLNATAKVNDNTVLNARYNVMNHNEFGTSNADKNQITVANLTTKGLLHNTNLMIGRYDLNLGQTTYLSGTAGMVDGVQANIKDNKFTAMLGYASMKDVFTTAGNSLTYTSPTPAVAAKAAYDYQDNNGVTHHVAAVAAKAATGNQGVDNTYYTELGYAFDNNVKMDVNYLKNQDRGDGNKVLNVIGAGLNARVLPNVRVIGDYWKNRADDINGGNDATGYVARLAWKGNDAKVPHSFGIAVEYLKMDKDAANPDMTGAFIKVQGNTANTATTNEYTGVKAWDVQFNYTLAPNITLDALYQFNMKDPATGNDCYSDNFTRVQVNYMF